MLCLRNCRPRWRLAASVRVNTSRPVVSLSRRCTIPRSPVARSSRSRAVRLSHARTSSCRVPRSPGSNGTVDMPAGLRTTMTWSSTNTTALELRRAWELGRGAFSMTSSFWFGLTGAPGSVTVAPSIWTFPVSIRRRTRSQGIPPSWVRRTASRRGLRSRGRAGEVFLGVAAMRIVAIASLRPGGAATALAIASAVS